MAQVDVRSLGANPRPIKIMCTKDGMIRTFGDDGGALTLEGFKANAKRSEIYKLQRDRNGQLPMWVAVEPIRPAFNGDPLADFPVLDAKMKRHVEAQVERRRQRTVVARRQAKEEIASRAKAAKAGRLPEGDPPGGEDGGGDG